MTLMGDIKWVLHLDDVSSRTVVSTSIKGAPNNVAIHKTIPRETYNLQFQRQNFLKGECSIPKNWINYFKIMIIWLLEVDYWTKWIIKMPCANYCAMIN